MLKIKNIFLIIVVNVFLFIAVSMVSEYFFLQGTMIQLDQTVSRAAKSASRTALLSDEFYTDIGNNTSGNDFSKIDENSAGTDNVLHLYDFEKKKWFYINPYITAANYISGVNNSDAASGAYTIPFKTLTDSNECNAGGIHAATNGSSFSTVSSIKVFETLFGTPNSATNGAYSYGTSVLEGITGTYPSALSWAGLQDAYHNGAGVETSANRQPSPKFKEFAQSLCSSDAGLPSSGETGLLMNTSGRAKEGVSSWKPQMRVIPILALMGLRLYPCNEVSTMGTDGWVSLDCLSPAKVTKDADGHHEAYIYTPNALGVTYVDPTVYKICFESALQQQVLLNRVTEGGSDYSAAKGCISTEAYSDSGTAARHDSTGSNGIINDGLVEYEMDSTKVSVDYYVVYTGENGVDSDYKAARGTLLSETVGVVPGTSSTSDAMAQAFQSSDTQNTAGVSAIKNKVVARITTTVRIHIPFRSPVLQYMYYQTNGNRQGHFDIPSFSKLQGDAFSDSLYYTTVQYAMVSR